jgi:hypothetical protein
MDGFGLDDADEVPTPPSPSFARAVAPGHTPEYVSTLRTVMAPLPGTQLVRSQRGRRRLLTACAEEISGLSFDAGHPFGASNGSPLSEPFARSPHLPHQSPHSPHHTLQSPLHQLRPLPTSLQPPVFPPSTTTTASAAGPSKSFVPASVWNQVPAHFPPAAATRLTRRNASSRLSCKTPRAGRS